MESLSESLHLNGALYRQALNSANSICCTMLRELFATTSVKNEDCGLVRRRLTAELVAVTSFANKLSNYRRYSLRYPTARHLKNVLLFC